MCGRYFLRASIRDVLKYYFEHVKDKPTLEYEPREIFPSDSIPVVHRGKEVEKTMHLMKWGFAPSYMNKLLINARSETVAEKKTFSEAFFRRRCLIPASGYYEWEKVEDSTGKIQKIKRTIEVKEREIVSLAGLYDRFQDKNGQLYWAVTILTKEASDDVKQVHDRMPVIIDRKSENAWLDVYETDYSPLFDIIRHASPRLKVE